MALLIGAMVSGIAVGMLYGLLGFSVILLYKTTGVANFAAGMLATGSVFIAYQFIAAGWSLAMAIAVTLPCAAALGAFVYFATIRPHDDAGPLNLTIRTFGVVLLIQALLAASWAQGEPYVFPSVLPKTAAFEISGLVVSWLTVGIIVLAVGMTAVFAALFRITRYGLAMLALAERPEIVRLLGFRTRTMTMVAWIAVTLVALMVGLLVTPSSQLSSIALEPYLILALSGAVIGGLTSLYGVFVAGITLGVLDNVVALYLSADIATLIIYCFLLAALIVWPSGWFGHRVAERL